MRRLGFVQRSAAMALAGLVLAACATAGTRGTIKAVTSAAVPALAGS